MMMDSTNDAGPPDDGMRRRRRPRYSGTHPKRYDQKYKELNSAQYPGISEHVRAQGRTPAGTHIPILVREILETLKPQPGETVADCTLGYGGHAEAFWSRIRPDGRLLGLDVDGVQLERTRERLVQLGIPLHSHHSNYAGILKAIQAEGLDGVDILFADLGVSSMQIDDPTRGFSYKHDGPLDMRMDLRRKRTAADFLAILSAQEISAALNELADEPDHKQIADAIVRQRRNQPVTNTAELVRLIFDAKGITRDAWRRIASDHPNEPHPAARTFQALRILVNDELSGLKELLRVAPSCLRAGGRIGIITFHSGEDRLVKKVFEESRKKNFYTLLTEEPVRPSAEERRANPRSTPAKFRAAIC